MGESGSTALYGPGDGLGVGVGYRAFGVRLPQHAGDVIELRHCFGAGDGGVKLFGEHDDPLGSKPAAQDAAD